MESLQILDDLLLYQLRELYHSEQQLLVTLPGMIRKASTPELARLLEEHMRESQGHVNRLEEIFDLIGQPAKALKCKGMAGILGEGEKLLKQKASPDTLDAAIILSAQKAEHYEICAYGSAATWAEMIGRMDIKTLLGQTLNEEQRADQRLTRLAKAGINRRSAEQPRKAA